MITIEKTILDVLQTLQQMAPSYISGGYLRDKLLGIPPHDVDIITTMSIQTVQELFPQLQGTKTGLAFGVGRFTKDGIPFEISTYEGSTVEEIVCEKDFVMNSLYHDGVTLYDPHHGIDDITKKIIRPLDDTLLHITKKPDMYLRAIRLSAQVGFSLDPTLHTFLQTHTSYFHACHPSRIQQEGHRILRSAYPFHALELLYQYGFINAVPLQPIPSWPKDRAFPSLNEHVYIKLLLLAEYTGIDFIHQFIDTFQLTKHLKEQIHPLYPYLQDNSLPTSPFLRNKVILLKRWQYQDQPEQFQAFIQQLKNN